MTSSREQFCSSHGVIPLILNLNDRVGLKSGYSTRGVSSQLTLRLYSLTDVTSSKTAQLSIFSECTSEIRAGPGMTLAVDA